jgi:hypothetical protein
MAMLTRVTSELNMMAASRPQGSLLGGRDSDRPRASFAHSLTRLLPLKTNDHQRAATTTTKTTKTSLHIFALHTDMQNWRTRAIPNNTLTLCGHFDRPTPTNMTTATECNNPAHRLMPSYELPH